jgi:hypothetical protein
MLLVTVKRNQSYIDVSERMAGRSYYLQRAPKNMDILCVSLTRNILDPLLSPRSECLLSLRRKSEMRFKRTKTKSNANTEVAEEFTSKYNRKPEIDKEFKAKVKGTESQTVLSPLLRYYITPEEPNERQSQ